MRKCIFFLRPRWTTMGNKIYHFRFTLLCASEPKSSFHMSFYFFRCWLPCSTPVGDILPALDFMTQWSCAPATSHLVSSHMFEIGESLSQFEKFSRPWKHRLPPQFEFFCIHFHAGLLWLSFYQHLLHSLLISLSKSLWECSLLHSKIVSSTTIDYLSVVSCT